MIEPEIDRLLRQLDVIETLNHEWESMMDHEYPYWRDYLRLSE